MGGLASLAMALPSLATLPRRRSISQTLQEDSDFKYGKNKIKSGVHWKCEDGLILQMIYLQEGNMNYVLSNTLQI